MKYVYNTIGGTLEVELQSNFARVINIEKPKLFTGPNEFVIHDKILAWIYQEFGDLNYRIASSSFKFAKLTQREIDSNLNRFKSYRNAQLAMSKRLAGEFDVMHTLVCEPYTESHFYIVKEDATYTTAGSDAQQVHKEIAEFFTEQGYYKVWRPLRGESPVSPGLAPCPVTDYRAVSSDGSLV